MTDTDEHWPKRILVTGASGNIGTALLRRLAAVHPNLDVVAVARRRPQEPTYDAAHWHTIDVADFDAANQLSPLMIGIDAVVHLAWGFQPTRDRHASGHRGLVHRWDADVAVQPAQVRRRAPARRGAIRRRIDVDRHPDATGVRPAARRQRTAALRTARLRPRGCAGCRCFPSTAACSFR